MGYFDGRDKDQQDQLKNRLRNMAVIYGCICFTIGFVVALVLLG